MRVSVEQAVKRGWLSATQASALRAELSGLRSVQRTAATQTSKRAGRAETTRAASASHARQPTQQPTSPQALLQEMLLSRWPGAAVPEYDGAVPGRRYRLDMAFPSAKLAVECDGWQYHGKYLADFKRDRTRDRDLVLQGWRVLRFYASEIRDDLESVVEQISRALRY